MDDKNNDKEYTFCFTTKPNYEKMKKILKIK